MNVTKAGFILSTKEVKMIYLFSNTSEIQLKSIFQLMFQQSLYFLGVE